MFSDRFNKAMFASGKSIDQVITLLRTSRPTLRQWQDGEHYPKLKSFMAMCRIFGVDPNYLLQDELPGIVSVRPPKGEEHSGPHSYAIAQKLMKLSDHQREIIEELVDEFLKEQPID